ncbi:MAG: MerR family transcriptional regulator [Eubacteriales bacterium]|nr:MerR family transcriptional regulator [Eubacteriales bacterium]
MKPKDVALLLSMSPEKIKFYKKSKVFSPEHSPQGNHPTEYTPKDIENLKILQFLTRSGLTTSDIRKIQSGKDSLIHVLFLRKKKLEKSIGMKEKALSSLDEFLRFDSQSENGKKNSDWEELILCSLRLIEKEEQEEGKKREYVIQERKEK